MVPAVNAPNCVLLARRLYWIGEGRRLMLPVLRQNPRLGIRPLDVERELRYEERRLLRTLRER